MDTKYYKDNNNHIHSFEVDYDDCPWNPRTEDEANIGVMHIWDRDYSIGDKHDFSNLDDAINTLVRDNIKDSTIINFIKNNKTTNNLEIKYNRKERVYEIHCDYRDWCNHEIKRGIVAYHDNLDFLIDDIIEELSMIDKIKLLEKKGFLFLMCHMYKHSGATIGCSEINVNPGYPFNDRFDAGCVGYIYTTKDKLLKETSCFYNEKTKKMNKITPNNWRVAATEYLKQEVKMVDMYINNECYWFKDTNLETGEEYSVGGFYSEKFGEELVKELAFEAGIHETLYDNEEEAA